MIGNYPVIIFAQLNTTEFKDAESYFLNYSNSKPILNPLYCSQTLNVTNSYVNSACKLVITSNGIDGNGTPIDTFNIDNNKFVNSKIFFVVRVKSIDDNPIKNVPLLSSGEISLSLVDINNTPILSTIFYSNFNSLSDSVYGGFYKGYFVSSLSANNVKITATCSVSGVTLSGQSNAFNIYPATGIYDIRKINEDNNQAAQFKSLAFQQILQDKSSLFNEFLGQIVGDSKSDPNTLGIEIYEKIANFVQNNTDIVYSNLPQFISMMQSTNTIFEEYNVQFPPSLQRLVDIFSISLSHQRGMTNQYSANFDSKGYDNSSTYGLNKGSIIDFNTGILYNTTNINLYTQIVLHEKFSNQFTLVNSLIPDDTSLVYIDSTTQSYALSSYKSSWGWGLVLPINIPNADIPKYYDFYRYTDNVEGSLLQKFIDFDNINNTYLVNCSSYTQYASAGGIIDNILTQHLYANVGIISG